jgi:hypothetical protein
MKIECKNKFVLFYPNCIEVSFSMLSVFAPYFCRLFYLSAKLFVKYIHIFGQILAPAAKLTEYCYNTEQQWMEWRLTRYRLPCWQLIINI